MLLPRVHQPVADAGFGLDQRRMRWIGLDLLAKVRDVNAQVLTVFLRFRAPDFAQYLAMRNDSAGVAHEEPQQRVLGGRQLYFLAVARDAAAREIDLKTVVRKYGFVLGWLRAKPDGLPAAF